MFRRFYFLKYLLAVAVCLATAWISFSIKQARYKPASIQHFIEQKVANAYQQFDQLATAENVPEQLLQNQKELQDAHYYFYRDGQLIAWNNNSFVVAPNELVGEQSALLQKDPFQFIAYKKTWNDGRDILIMAVPVINHYPINNRWMKNGVVGRKEGTASYQLYPDKEANDLQLSLPNMGSPIYLSFDAEENKELAPAVITWVAALLAGLIFLIWQYLICIYVGKVKGKVFGAICLLALLSLNVSLIYTLSFPFNLEKLPLFSPELFASNVLLPSMGHLIILVIQLTAFIVYLISQKVFKPSDLVYPWRVRLMWALFITLLQLCMLMFMQKILITMVIDSGVSFQMTRFSNLNIFSFLSICIIALFYGSLLTLTAHLNFYVKLLQLPAYVVYIIRVLCLLVTSYAFYHIFLFPVHLPIYNLDFFLVVNGCWLFLFLWLVDVWHVGKNEIALFGRKVIFWTLYTAMSLACMIYYLKEFKEKSLREKFAERILSNRDLNWEWEYAQLFKSINADHDLLDGLKNTQTSGLNSFENKMRTDYLFKFQKDYNIDFYFLSSDGQKPLKQVDSSVLGKLKVYAQSQLLNEKNSYLFERNNDNTSNYIALIHAANVDVPVWVFANFMRKPHNIMSPYRDVLNDQTDAVDKLLPFYTYGLFDNGVLQFQNRAAVFNIDSNILAHLDKKFNWHISYNNTLLLVKQNEKLLVIKTMGNTVWSIITLFSYFFICYLFGGIIIQLCYYFWKRNRQRKAKRNLYSVPLSEQINYGLLGIVFATIIAAGFSIRYFVQNKNEENLEGRHFYSLKFVENELENLMQDYKDLPAFPFTEANKQLRNFAMSSNIAINLFDAQGKLQVSTNPELQNLGLQSGYIDYKTLMKLRSGNTSAVLSKTQLESLEYTSIYSVLRNKEGQTAAIIQLPFYLSNTESHEQLDSIVLAMINIYSLIFLFIAFLALYFSRTITKSLQEIAYRFENMSLEKLELIEKTGNDEIGRLKIAYNTMALKLKDNAIQLKAHERESAWREMAQQVAHEIKNPLTPMRLNIQYLQMLQKDNPQLAQERGPKMLANIEVQIDQLTNIASAFSAFAKLPQMVLENLLLNKLVESIAALYKEIPGIQIQYEETEPEIRVLSDEKYLARVLTNLMQNAVQAIPENSSGLIIVSLQKIDKQALISITDNGIGMTEEVQGKVFQPHFTTKSFGTGLGLAISKKITEELGGQLSFKTQEGMGTTFIITLPLHT